MSKIHAKRKHLDLKSDIDISSIQSSKNIIIKIKKILYRFNKKFRTTN